MFLANIMMYALAADISIIKLLISCSKYGLYLCIERERSVPEEIEFDYTWLHVQGRYIVFDDKVADPTASFSSVEHLCVSRQSLTDTELFQFEWVPDQK